ncbi:tRNA (adenine-N(1)-)-methyltransferase catalytic subunit trm61 [Loxospora ochrophaea]|nr:tRNA (adenine-N(1)-)-methyltransferase catalytic subunit trm61 [Loxospora ochrophaea]
MQSFQPSPFLNPGPCAEVESLAVLRLKRDHQIPTLLRNRDDENEGYDEGKVTNTRFGSFPHSTLINLPWGSQVRASAVDTGSRGRRGGNQASAGQKRKLESEFLDVSSPVITSHVKVPTKAAVPASTGFAHLLPPTPESWTASLPHRTQVVYTPDYSYILQRLRVRPGSVVIEAGAGSGSFTHAAARAVFNGSQATSELINPSHQARSAERGKVWSFEFHEQRVGKLEREIRDHRLNDVVKVFYQDVCKDGFYPIQGLDENTDLSADAIFLDLPAPWLALKHLFRRPRLSSTRASAKVTDESQLEKDWLIDYNPVEESTQPPLTSKKPVQLCTFSPCIEQVQRTVTTLKQLGWLEIEVVEIAAKRIEVRRERVGLQEEGLRGVTASPSSVDEAVVRLKEIESRFKSFHDSEKVQESIAHDEFHADEELIADARTSKQQRVEKNRSAVSDRKIFKEGRLVHKVEPELKTHTSYLLFALLPLEWTAEDEQKTQLRWPARVATTHKGAGIISRRQMKKNARAQAADVKMHIGKHEGNSE